jgi:regulator of sigma E protease
MSTLLAFLVTIAILIVIHEFGHYAAARANGVKVLRFSVGFGPVLARRSDRHGTEWALSAIPLGGYVKMLDEREGEVVEADLPYAFNRKGVRQRFVIVAAGPLANFALAILLYWALYVHGVPVLKPVIGEPPAGTPAAMAGFQAGERITTVNGEAVEDWQGLHWLVLKHGMGTGRLQLETRNDREHINSRQLDLSAIDLAEQGEDPLAVVGLRRYLPEFPPIIGQVVTGSPAERAGLRQGDRLLSIDGEPLANWQAAVERIRARPGQTLRMLVERDGGKLDVSVLADAAQAGGETIGRIGAAPWVDPALMASLQGEVRFGALEAMKRALQKTWDLSVFSLEMLGRMVIGEASLKNLSGPITIADYAGRSAEAGTGAFVAFLALISVSLGVLNLLPIPLLDGGHLLYYLAEFFTGRPVPDAVQAIGQKVGAALLAALMFFALFNDFHRLFAG